MAEFTQRAKNKRILRSIDTKKSSTQEVFDFYKRWKNQQKISGPTLSKGAKKADIIKELERMEKIQHENLQAASKAATERSIKKEFEQIRKSAFKATTAAEREKFMQRTEKFNKKLESMKKSGKIGQDFKGFAATSEPAKPRRKHPDISSNTKTTATRRTNIYYKGTVAHDYIKKLCDDGLLDTDDFDDSQEIWQAVDDIEENPRDYQFFLDNYAGKYKKGSKDFYYEFLDTLKLFDKFEDAMAKAKKEIPEKYTPEYWDAVMEWSGKL